MSRALALGVACAALLSGACAIRRGPAPLLPVVGEEARIAALLERTRVEGSERQSIRALASVHLESRNGSGRFREVIVAERPARLRLETLNLLGHTQTLLVTDGQSFAFFDGQRLERGRLAPDVLRRTLGLDLDPAEAVAVLLAAPLLPNRPPRAVFGQGADRIVELESKRLRFGSRGDLLAVEALDPGGAVRWSARYSHWRHADGGRYPFTVVLDFPATSLRAELALRSVDLNPDLDPALFRVPAGVGE